MQIWKYVTCSEKKDHSEFFNEIEFLARMDSFMYTKYNDESFTKNIDHKPSYDHSYALMKVHYFNFQRIDI